MNSLRKQKIPLTIITGFLGSGKTTFLQGLLSNVDEISFAVVINELGATSLDHLLVNNIDDPLIDLPQGCVCCNSSDQLVETIQNLTQERAGGNTGFDHLIIETSGATNTAVMIENLWRDPHIRDHYELAPVICIVSSHEWRIEQVKEAGAQLSVADFIIISKSDLISPAIRNKTLARLDSGIDTFNSHAKNIYTPIERNEYSSILEVSPVPLQEKKISGENSANSQNHLKDSYSSFTLRHTKTEDIKLVDQFLDLLLHRHGEKLLRVKGLFQTVQSPDRPMVIQAVGNILSSHSYLEHWPSSQESFLNIIHSGADRKKIEELFGSIFAHASFDRPDAKAIIENPLAIIGSDNFKPD